MNKYSELSALETVGHRLKSLRVRKDMDQQELADHCGLSRKTITNLETGRNVSLLNLFKVLKAMGELDRIDDFIPEHQTPPAVLAKTKGIEKTMVRKSQRRDKPAKEEWKWSK
jgi:transcriptional regulator with XRE-family HTH domain